MRIISCASPPRDLESFRQSDDLLEPPELKRSKNTLTKHSPNSQGILNKNNSRCAQLANCCAIISSLNFFNIFTFDLDQFFNTESSSIVINLQYNLGPNFFAYL